MIDPEKLEELSKKFTDKLPPGLSKWHSELQKTFKTCLMQGLKNFKLVTRDEFDQQVKLLAECRKILEELQKKFP